jgi:hypothetical protein
MRYALGPTFSLLLYSFTISVVFHVFFLNQLTYTTLINDMEVSIIFSLAGHSVGHLSQRNITVLLFISLWSGQLIANTSPKFLLLAFLWFSYSSHRIILACYGHLASSTSNCMFISAILSKLNTVNPHYNRPGCNGQILAVYNCEFLKMLRR